MSGKLSDWAREANIPSQHVDYCVNLALNSKLWFDDIGEFVKYLYTVQMDDKDVWDDLFWKWNDTLNSFLTSPRVTVTVPLYRGICCQLKYKPGFRFRLSRYSYSTQKEIALGFAKENGGLLTVLGPKVVVPFSKTAFNEGEYLMAGGYYGTVTAVSVKDGKQFIDISTE